MVSKRGLHGKNAAIAWKFGFRCKPRAILDQDAVQLYCTAKVSQLSKFKIHFHYDVDRARDAVVDVPYSDAQSQAAQTWP